MELPGHRKNVFLILIAVTLMLFKIVPPVYVLSSCTTGPVSLESAKTLDIIKYLHVCANLTGEKWHLMVV